MSWCKLPVEGCYEPRRLHKNRAADIKVLWMQWTSFEMQSHACLDKHLYDPHYYTGIKRKSDVSLSLQICRRTFKQPLYPKNAGSLKHQTHCSEVPTVTQEFWGEHEKKTDRILHLPTFWVKDLPARQSSGPCESWVDPDLLRCSAHMCSHASHTSFIHSKAKVQNRMFLSLALHVYP